MTNLDPNTPPSTAHPLRGMSHDLETEFKNVLWAVDIETLAESAFAAASALSALAPNATVVPLHVLDPQGLNWSGESTKDRIEQLRPAAQASFETAIESLREKMGLRNVIKPLIAELHEVPVAGVDRQLVRKLLSRARRFHADLILVSHHTYGGLRRWLHPSFTETLIEESDLPLLVVNPQCTVSTRFRDLVFPTDFSPCCQHAFERTVALARALGARIRLFYKYSNLVDPVVQSGSLILGGGWVSLNGIIEPTTEDHVRLGQEWAEQAVRAGVDFEFISEDSGLGAASTIASFCESSRDPLLVMSAPPGGPLSAGLWGSITRDILKQSVCPCLILRG